ncbi:uncharacterized protein LOC134249101 [Saccostrea cucullata]|uniref:uncharacterized protein LOC134249101 n=1 Tax=Saccostrea cuccullata TaxID=36930 RepID=UPI002ED6622F
MWQDNDHLCFVLNDSLKKVIGLNSHQNLLRRKIENVQNNIYLSKDSPVIKIESSAEGFRMLPNDIDHMFIDKNVQVSEKGIYSSSRTCQVRMEKSKPHQPGYVKLNLLTPDRANRHLRQSACAMDGAIYISSDLYVKLHLGENEEQHGPSLKKLLENGTELDEVHCLYCVHWPSDAEEWYFRKRSHGWPDTNSIQTIYNNGCHVVPIGSKSIDRYGNWSVDPFIWRLSFSMAEKHLVYTMNDTQLLVYGTFKLLLKEAFENNCDTLCSYFMKTLVFWSIEESPSALWHPLRLVSCIEVCLKRLISWVSKGFCPNYFVRENNMFYGRLDEKEQCVLINHLFELYAQGWRCLLRCPSMKPFEDALQNTNIQIPQMSNDYLNTRESNFILPEFNEESSADHEEEVDVSFFTGLENDVINFSDITGLKTMFFKTVVNFINEERDRSDIDIITLSQQKCLQRIALFSLDETLRESRCARFKYRQIRRALSLLNYTCRADISRGRLSLATAYYCLGNYSKALKNIKQYEDILHHRSGVLYVSSKYPTKVDDGYKKNFCSRALTRIERASLAVSYDFHVYQNRPIIPKEIALEILLVKTQTFFLSIPPRHYSLFLKALCFAKKGDKKKCET